MTTPERWLPVAGYGGLYEISDLGRVKSFHRRKVRLLKIHYNVESGYAYVVLSLNGTSRHWYVHTLVLEAFDKPCPPGMECRHEDGDRANARLTNLSWGTGSENNLDQVRHGTHNNASKKKCKNGHDYTPENTGYIYKPDGSIKQRVCKECSRDWRKRSEANRGASGPECPEEGCTDGGIIKGMCRKHYTEKWRAANPERERLRQERSNQSRRERRAEAKRKAA